MNEKPLPQDERKAILKRPLNFQKWGQNGDKMTHTEKIKRACGVYESLYALVFVMVPELGIEPRCPCERGILSPRSPGQLKNPLGRSFSGW